MSVRFGILRVQLVMSFDADDGENDDRGGLFRRIRAAEAHDAPLVGEFDNGTHVGGQPMSPACQAADPLPDARIGVGVN